MHDLILNDSFKKEGFPHDPYIKDKWIAATGRKDWFPTKYSTICSIHFENSSFIEGKKLRMLKKTACPTINILKHIDNEEENKETLQKPLSFSWKIKLEQCETRSKHLVPHAPGTAPYASFARLVLACIREKRTHRHGQLKGADKKIIHGVCEDGEAVKSNHRLIDQRQVVLTARGLCPPVFTPLNEDYSVNYEAIAPYAEYLDDNGIKSVLVGGTTGEHMSLSVTERKKIVDQWVKVGKSFGLHIMVQVGGAPVADVLDLARYCSEIGVDSLLTLPELYFKPQTASELVSYVELIAHVAPSLPVLYYHIPSMSKVEINMPAFVTEATIRIPNFKGIKFTSNDLSEAAQVLRCLKDGQEIFLGADTLLAPAALLGIKSSIGTTFNLFPRLAQDILDAVEGADIAQARALQEKLSLAVEAHTVEGAWVPIMKAGMEIVTGIKVGPPALPQRPISKEAKINIESRLRALELIY